MFFKEPFLSYISFVHLESFFLGPFRQQRFFYGIVKHLYFLRVYWSKFIFFKKSRVIVTHTDRNILTYPLYSLDMLMLTEVSIYAACSGSQWRFIYTRRQFVLIKNAIQYRSRAFGSTTECCANLATELILWRSRNALPFKGEDCYFWPLLAPSGMVANSGCFRAGFPNTLSFGLSSHSGWLKFVEFMVTWGFNERAPKTGHTSNGMRYWHFVLCFWFYDKRE